MSKNGKRYTDEFKGDVMRLIKEGKRSATSVAKDLGINPQTVYNWVNENKNKQIPENVRIAELEAELRAEKRKTSDLEETVAILKKCTAIFAANNRK